MVKKKSGRTLNPADAHRKAMRQKEIKKNKAERKRVRTLVMVHKDTTKLEEEVSRYRSLDKDKRLDKNGKAKLKDLQDKLSKIVETKKAHGVNLKKDTKPKTDHTPIYFHPTLNPSGLPPPGVSIDSEGERVENKDESEEEIPLPPGQPPADKDSSDNDLPELPPGPPPTQKKNEADDNDQGEDDDEEEDDDSDNEDDDLPKLPPGPPPSSMTPPSIRALQNTTLTGGQMMMPPPFGYTGAPGTLPSAPPFGGPHSPSSPFATFNGLHGSHSIRPQMRTPPPPPFTGKPHSLSPQFSHYGPPPPGVPGNLMPMTRPYPQHIPPLSPSSPAATVQGMQMKPGVSPNKVFTSAATATPIIQAEPQVRNLQKELTTLVPAALLRKKASASKPKVSRPIVNAAPNIDDGMETLTPPVKRSASSMLPVVTQSSTTQEDSNDQQKSTAPPPAKKAKTKKKYDEYEKFMSEMQDLL
ncbi:1290_t:CDS:2 [Ambispora gerdemannii]|uniref:1290_t:CDS:1 n=1 Tax=Ambispora gerdemannii TaxID=144530 RepID=A0A9N9A269_9GLOM|nr:1290_t:CDS:2 [Ambispora gerdemannii]